jgi:hypothetical protein
MGWERIGVWVEGFMIGDWMGDGVAGCVYSLLDGLLGLLIGMYFESSDT